MACREVRVGIVGVGNCASSFVQGLSYYKDANSNETIPGLMNVELGGYHIGDVEVSAAFDVNAGKVGRDVSEAVFARPNNTQRFSAVPESGIRVHRGRTLDGLGKYLRDEIEESDEAEADGGAPLNVELKLEVWDSPNPAGIVIDAVSCAKLALDRQIGGALTGPSSSFMKSPPQQFTDSEARERTVRFVAGEDA
jgi:myo-inositol-1-phosphate synthase